MKKRVSILMATALLLATSATVYAQKGNVKADLNYNYSMPLGDFKNNTISNGSPRGGSVNIMYSLSNKLAIGGGTGFQDYYQKYPRAIYKTGDNETTSAVLSNSIQSVPLMEKLLIRRWVTAVLPYNHIYRVAPALALFRLSNTLANLVARTMPYRLQHRLVPVYLYRLVS